MLLAMCYFTGQHFSTLLLCRLQRLAMAITAASLSVSLLGCVSSSEPNDFIAPAFPSANQSFADYQDAVREHITPLSLSHRSPKDIERNLPFEVFAKPNVPYRGQFLLLHGLSDSAGAWLDHANALSELGFDSRAVLFPGHGSTPEQMLDVRYEWWMTAARQQLARYKKPEVPLFLGGFSMGAVIATRLALENPDIAGLFLVSPAFHSRLNHYIRFAGLYKKKEPWMFGGMILEDNPIKYNSIPINSLWQFYRLTESLKHRWGKQQIEIPTVMVSSNQDSIIDTDYTRRVFNNRFVNPKSRLIVYDKDASNSSDAPTFAALSSQVNSNRIVWRSSRFLENRILSQSHLGLMYAPENEMFGQVGDVLVCNGNKPAVFFGCLRAKGHWFGAQHEPSPDGVAVARSTYNVEFDWVVSAIDWVFSSPASLQTGLIGFEKPFMSFTDR